MRKFLSVSIALFTGLVAHAGRAATLDVEDVALFNPMLGELPESVALDKEGNRYMSMSNVIRKLTPEGEMTVFGTLPIPVFALGIKFGPDGCLYTASTSLNPQVVGAFVWRICSEGVVEQFVALDPAGGPNDLAFDSGGNMYVTDPTLGLIWKVTPGGEPTVWLDHHLLKGDPQDPAMVFSAIGVDGIAFDERERNLYVSNLDHGSIVRISRSREGEPAGVSEFVSSPLLRGADGIAFDKQGTLYVAVSTQDRIASVARDGTITVLAEGGLLDGPSNVAFGTTGGDKRTLYITSLALSRAFGFRPGTPRPALQRADVPHKGQP